jgi:hypothetical protein
MKLSMAEPSKSDQEKAQDLEKRVLQYQALMPELDPKTARIRLGDYLRITSYAIHASITKQLDELDDTGYKLKHKAEELQELVKTGISTLEFLRELNEKLYYKTEDVTLFGNRPADAFKHCRMTPQEYKEVWNVFDDLECFIYPIPILRQDVPAFRIAVLAASGPKPLLTFAAYQLPPTENYEDIITEKVLDSINLTRARDAGIPKVVELCERYIPFEKLQEMTGD